MSMSTVCRETFVWFCFKIVSSVVILILIIFIVRDAIINNLNIVFELFFDTPFCNVPSIYRPVGYCSFAERFGVFSYPSGSTKVTAARIPAVRSTRLYGRAFERSAGWRICGLSEVAFCCGSSSRSKSGLSSLEAKR